MALSPQDSGQLAALIAQAETAATAAAVAQTSADFAVGERRDLLLAARVANLEVALAIALLMLAEAGFELPAPAQQFLEVHYVS